MQKEQKNKTKTKKETRKKKKINKGNCLLENLNACQ